MSKYVKAKNVWKRAKQSIFTFSHLLRYLIQVGPMSANFFACWIHFRMILESFHFLFLLPLLYCCCQYSFKNTFPSIPIHGIMKAKGPCGPYGIQIIWSPFWNRKHKKHFSHIFFLLHIYWSKHSLKIYTYQKRETLTLTS